MRRYHVAICYVAHGKPPGPVGTGKGEYSVDHKDGNKDNYHWRNLAWVLHSENVARGNSNR